MPSVLSNHFKYQCYKQKIDLSVDIIKVILMDTGFIFDPDQHEVYAHVMSEELASGNGYLQNNKVLTGQTLTEDDAEDRAEMLAEDVTWTASGGDIGPTPGAILYDDSSPDNTIIGFIDFGEELTATNGNSLVLENIAIRFS